MKVLDPGHSYTVDNYAAKESDFKALINGDDNEQLIMFIHRIGEGYPGNQGEEYNGTNCQEVLRVLIDRCKYLNTQIPCEQTAEAIIHLRQALQLFERRAALRKGRSPDLGLSPETETYRVCRICGHMPAGCTHWGFR